MKYDRAFFDGGIKREGTNAVKWCAPNIMDDSTIPLWVADMDFPCAQPIVDALVKRALHACYGYTCTGEEDSKALIGFWKRRHGLSIHTEDLTMLHTVVTGLRACVQVMTQPGDGVIIQTPVYGPFTASIRQSDREVLDAALVRDEKGRYGMNYEAIEGFLKQGARLMMLCNPHNPVGRAWSREEMQTLLALLKRYNCRLVSDEIHADFVYVPHQFIPVLTLSEASADTVVLVSASKTFNIAGLQQAASICRDHDVNQLLKSYLERTGAGSGNIFALIGTQAAYSHCDDWLDALKIYLMDNQQFLLEAIGDLLPRAIVSPMEATYLAWVDIGAYDISHCEIGERCRKHNVALTDGQFFGQSSGKGFMRINYGCPRSQLAEGLKRFASAIKEV